MAWKRNTNRSTKHPIWRCHIGIDSEEMTTYAHSDDPQQLAQSLFKQYAGRAWYVHIDAQPVKGAFVSRRSSRVGAGE